MRQILPKTLFPFLLVLIAGCAGAQKAPPPMAQGEEAQVQAQTQVPTATPTPKPPRPQRGPLTLAFVGDIMMGGSAANKLKSEGADSFFTQSAPLLKQADVVIGNLEGPLGTEGKVWIKKSFTFLVDPSAAGGLARAGFDVLVLANNHTLDYGPDALRTTIEALRQENLAFTGAGMNLAEARAPAWVEKNGWKVAVLSYSKTYPVEFWAGDDRPGCAPADGYLMREDIASAREQGADLVVVACHWGQEKKTKLRFYQPDLAHLALEAGADAVIGHHPHIWQSLEVHQGKPIAYSVGNFAFGSLNTSCTESGILYLTFDRERRWSGGRVVPLDVNNYRVRFDPTPMKEPAARKFHQYLRDLSPKASLSLEGAEILWKAPAEAKPVGSLPGM